ncbi:hypothetical protein PPYR_14186 [Photinus pyralis]|uniref:RNA-directed DNA polymerase n=1 Tax=Photinus pyralis TaxID=7054 RepID=A0A5N4A4J3_PHOPY|nr:hypothetical protein PPYR_14186 [Photinus pyralis]
MSEFKIKNELQLLKSVIINGWPKNIKYVNDAVKIYWKYKHELTVINDLIFRNTALVIPRLMRKEMLERVHYNHSGIQKCLKIASESIYWPTMNNDIKQTIINCEICMKYSNSQIKEPLQSHEIPRIPWNKVGCDLFEIRGQKYLLVIDYYSKYLEIEKLELDIGMHVMVQIKPNTVWTPGRVVSILRNRTYKVKMENGAILIRNRKFIKINYKRNCPSFTMRKEGSEQRVDRNDIRPEPTKVYIDIENENNNVIENKSE